MSGYILYRGSRDQLNELCRVKDERIEKLEDSLRLVRLWMEGTYNPQGWGPRDPQDDRGSAQRKIIRQFIMRHHRVVRSLGITDLAVPAVFVGAVSIGCHVVIRASFASYQ